METQVMEDENPLTDNVEEVDALLRKLKQNNDSMQYCFDRSNYSQTCQLIEQIINDSLRRQPVEAVRLKIAELEDGIKKSEKDIRLRLRIIIAMIVVVCCVLVAVSLQIFRYEKNRRANRAMSVANEQSRRQLDKLARLLQEIENEIRQVTKQNEQLDTSNAVKDRLLSVISHDLRSPISTLQALLNLFNANQIERSDLLDLFDKLLSRVENTSTMLENLLHWSHYQLEGFEPIFDRVDLQTVIDECIRLFRMQAEQKHIMIDNTLKTTVRVYADAEMLKVIIRNLISNALKFTHSDGIITILTTRKDRDAVVSIKDTGVGISAENQIKLFAMNNFTTSGTEKEKGTGLGLKLCKDFVEHNRGKIWVDSAINVGTTFYFSIPLAD